MRPTFALATAGKCSETTTSKAPTPYCAPRVSVGWCCCSSSSLACCRTFCTLCGTPIRRGSRYCVEREKKKENNEPRWMERIWVVGSPAEDPLAQAEAHRSVPRNENALFGLAGLRGRSESRRRGHALLNRSPSLFVQKQALSDFGRSQQIWPRPHYAQYTKMSDSITVRYSSLLLLVVGILETVMDRWFGYCKPSVAMETKQCTSTVSVSLFAPAP